MKRVDLKLILTALLWAVIVTNCGPPVDQTDTPEQQTTKPPEHALVLRLSANKQFYQPGETIVVNVSVENAYSEPISYTMWNGGDPPIYVTVDSTPYSDRFSLYEKDYEAREIHPIVTSDVINPGQRITREVIWNQLLPTYPDRLQAPPGKYVIQATFFMGKYSSDHEPYLVAAQIEIEITGTKAIITPEEALRQALELPEVELWYAEHSGPSLVKIENGEYYIRFEVGWQKVDPSAFGGGNNINQFQEYIPQHEVLLVNQYWQVHLFAPGLGPFPNEIRIEVDPNTGTAMIMQEQ